MGDAIRQALQTYGDVLTAFAIILPLAAALVWMLARWRRGQGNTRAFQLSLAEVGIVVGTAPWIWMTVRPRPDGIRAINLVPLRDLLNYDVDALPVQVVGNLLVFAALGFFLPMRFPALASLSRVMAVAAVGSVFIEALQYALDIGRVSSIDDVALNALGAGLAALLSRRWWLTRVPGELNRSGSGHPA